MQEGSTCIVIPQCCKSKLFLCLFIKRMPELRQSGGKDFTLFYFTICMLVVYYIYLLYLTKITDILIFLNKITKKGKPWKSPTTQLTLLDIVFYITAHPKKIVINMPGVNVILLSVKKSLIRRTSNRHYFWCQKATTHWHFFVKNVWTHWHYVAVIWYSFGVNLIRF